MITATTDEIIIADEPRRYWLGDQSYKSVTGILGEVGIRPDFSYVPKPILDHAIARGIAVHHATHLIDRDTLDESTVDPQISGFVDAYRRFRRECSVQIIAREGKLISPLGFGLRPDIIAWVLTSRAVVDLKTAQNLGKCTGPQTAGYLIGWNSSFPKQIVENRYGLRLQSNGYYKLIPYEDPDDALCFMDAFRWSRGERTEELEKRIKTWREKYAN